MLALPKRRETKAQWQRAAELLLAQTDVADLSKQVELALFYDVDLTLRNDPTDRQARHNNPPLRPGE
jgi:hypothetical protein